MSEPSYNIHVLTQYLLGTLPRTETEQLDELSVADEEVAESLSGVENDLVDAYVKGDLSDADLERFESYYLASPLRREKVAFAQTLQSWSEGIAVARERAQAETREKRKPAGWLSGPIILSARSPAWQWSFTALALLLLVAGGLPLIHNLRLRQQMKQTQARHDQLLQREQELEKEIETQRSAATHAEQELARVRDEHTRLEDELKQRAYQPRSEVAVVSLMLAPPMRGAGQLPAITLRPETNLVSIHLELDGADYSAYRVALNDPATDTILWRSETLRPRTNTNPQVIAVSVPARLLKPQNYALRVSGLTAGATEIVGDYPFKVMK